MMQDIFAIAFAAVVVIAIALMDWENEDEQ